MYSSGIAQRGMGLLSKICYKIEPGPKRKMRLGRGKLVFHRTSLVFLLRAGESRLMSKKRVNALKMINQQELGP